MRRIRLILAAVAAVVAMFIVVSGPAMADDIKFDSDDGVVFAGDGFFFDDDDNDFFFDDDNDFDFFFGDGISQSIDQDSDAGDVDISFGVS